MLTQKEISKLKRQYHYLPDFLKYNTMNTTRSASMQWWDTLTSAISQTLKDKHYPGRGYMGQDQFKCIEHIWIQEVVHPWFDGNRSHESFERKNKLAWHYFNISDFRLLTNEQRAICYLKEHEGKDDPNPHLKANVEYLNKSNIAFNDGKYTPKDKQEEEVLRLHPRCATPDVPMVTIDHPVDSFFDSGYISGENFCRTQLQPRIDILAEKVTILTEALEKIEKTYDWVEDAAGKIAHEALNKTQKL